jgi:quercetin dioxygenase-like cupin family protein
MSQGAYFSDLCAELPQIPPDSIVSRTIFQNDQVKVILFGFAAGQELSEHTSSKPAILHLLEGEASLTLGEERMDVRAGAWMHMPPDLPHSIKARTTLTMLLLLIGG